MRLAAAAQHLDELPDRAERCSPECAFLATAPPAQPPVACSLGAEQGDRVVNGMKPLVQDLDITIIDATIGEILRELTLDPTRNCQPTGRPPGPTSNNRT